MIFYNKILEGMIYIVGYIFHLYIVRKNCKQLTEILS